MECPRCGAGLLQGQVACARCGLRLETMAQVATGPTETAPPDLYALSEDALPAWLAEATRDHAPSPVPPPTSAPLAPPAAPAAPWAPPPGNPAQYLPPMTPPAAHSGASGNGAAGTDPHLSPISSVPSHVVDAVSRPLSTPRFGGMASPFGMGLSTPNADLSGLAPARAMQVQPPMSAMPQAMGQALGQGTILKGGRYRLLQRFTLAAPVAPDSLEPPLMLASDLEVTNSRVLIQELPLSQARPDESEQVRMALTHRLNMLARVPGMPHLVDSFGERRRHFLVFEYPSGDLLIDRLVRGHGPLPETTAVQIALQVLDALSGLAAAQPPLMHGNISPAHIVLRPSGQVTLVGFSPALLLRPHLPTPERSAGGVLGYAAPEQSRGHASERSDLFSVCAVLHHAVTGRAPSPRPTPLFQPARHLNPEVSLEVEEAISHGLRPSPAQRYNSAVEMRAALAPLASGRRATRVPVELREESAALAAPLRNAQGKLVLPGQRAMQNPLVLLGALLLLILVVGSGVLYALAPHGNPVIRRSTPTTLNERAALYQKYGIGLSGGEFVFDTQGPGSTEKQRAARALASGETANALRDYKLAVAANPADAEAAIYAADLQVLVNRQPYVTVVSAIAFGADPDAARAQLQGVFLAQQRANAYGDLPGGMHVRVLVLNSGTAANDAATATKILLDDIHAGNVDRLVGIVGWLASDQTRIAISTLAPSGLALVSPTASADNLGGNAANFFPLVPTDSQQAVEMANGAVTVLKAQRIVVLSDPQVPASTTMADAFAKQIEDQYSGRASIIARATYSATANDFRTQVADAIRSGADLLYLAGNDASSVALAQEVAKAPFAQRILPRVLVGPAAETAALYGLGTSPTAAAVRSDPGALNRLYITTFANTESWNMLGVDDAFHATVAGAFYIQFGPGASPGHPGLNPVTILSFDAARIMLAAASRDLPSNAASVTTIDPTRVRQRLLQFDGSQPYMGMAGAIAFSSTGRLPRKSLSIIHLTPVPQPDPSGAAVLAKMYGVIGGREWFCASAVCRVTP